MTCRYVLLALLLMGGVLVTNIAWAQSSTEIQELKVGCDKGSAKGCNLLGFAYQRGQGQADRFDQEIPEPVVYRFTEPR